VDVTQLFPDGPVPNHSKFQASRCAPFRRQTVTAPFFAAFGEGEIMDLTVIIACTSTIINSVALFRIFNVGARSFKFLKLGGKQWGNVPDSHGGTVLRNTSSNSIHTI